MLYIHSDFASIRTSWFGFWRDINNASNTDSNDEETLNICFI